MATIKMEYADQKQFEPMPDIDEDINYEVTPLNIDPNKTDPSRKRRFSVSAESSGDNKADRFVKKVYPKSKAALDRIKQSTVDVFLFQGLDTEQSKLLIDAMFEKKCKKGEDIVSQGDPGDYFYVIEGGIYEVWKSSNRKTPNVNATKVFQYSHKGAFGELALMYNAPRAATVRALTDGVLWAVDRSTFRHIIVGCTARKRKKYDNFLKDLSLLMNIGDDLRAAIADILETQVFRKGEFVLRAGDNAEHFFFVQKGEAIVTLTHRKKTVRKLSVGDFFGERALLMNDVRSANVVVASDKLEICGMDKAGFMRLLGPLYDKFRNGFKNYEFDDTPLNDDDDDGNISEIE